MYMYAHDLNILFEGISTIHVLHAKKHSFCQKSCIFVTLASTYLDNQSFACTAVGVEVESAVIDSEQSCHSKLQDKQCQAQVSGLLIEQCYQKDVLLAIQISSRLTSQTSLNKVTR